MNQDHRIDEKSSVGDALAKASGCPGPRPTWAPRAAWPPSRTCPGFLARRVPARPPASDPLPRIAGHGRSLTGIPLAASAGREKRSRLQPPQRRTQTRASTWMRRFSPSTATCSLRTSSERRVRGRPHARIRRAKRQRHSKRTTRLNLVRSKHVIGGHADARSRGKAVVASSFPRVGGRSSGTTTCTCCEQRRGAVRLLRACVC